MNKAHGMRSFSRKAWAVVESIDVQNYVPSKESGECKHDKQAPDLCELRADLEPVEVEGFEEKYFLKSVVSGP